MNRLRRGADTAAASAMIASRTVGKTKNFQFNFSHICFEIETLIEIFVLHIGSQGLLKKHFDDCYAFPSINMVKILGKVKFDRLLT